MPAQDGAGITCRGLELLSGTGPAFDPSQGAALLAEAARMGVAQAAARCAVLAGAGVCRPQSWDEALDYLEAAAEGGWDEARAQLRLLAADRSLAQPVGSVSTGPASDVWKRLRRSVDVGSWTRSPPKRVISEGPRLRVIEGFLPPEVCGWYVNRARGKLQRARIYSEADGTASVRNARTNSETDFNIVESDLVQVLVRARIAIATGLPPAVMELTKVLNYQVGQQYENHFDFIDPAFPGLSGELAQRGQRIATFLVYLNEDFEGGETDFPAIGWRYKGRTGDALLFANVDPSGAPDRRTLHAGLPPTRGEKWLLSQWIRDRAPAGR
jgi:hypothetical protein